MDELTYIRLLRIIALIGGISGTVIGLDLVLGGRVFSVFRRILDRSFDLDKRIANPKTQRVLGIAFLLLALIIFLLIKRI